MKLTKNQWYIVGVVALIAIWYFFIRKKPTVDFGKTVPTDSVNNYTGDEDDEEDGFTSGRQIVEPIISFVIGMKESTNDDVINRFLKQMQQNGSSQFAQPIVTFVNRININYIRGIALMAFSRSMHLNKGDQFVEPIVSFVIGMKESTNDDIVINRFRNKMQGI